MAAAARPRPPATTCARHRRPARPSATPAHPGLGGQGVVHAHGGAPHLPPAAAAATTGAKGFGAPPPAPTPPAPTTPPAASIPATPTPLEVWAAAAGVRAPKVRVADFGGLRGLAATAPIADGETIITLPVSAALLVRPKSRCPLPAAWCTPDAWRAAPWYLKMGLLILEAAARPPPPPPSPSSPSSTAAAGAVDGAAAYVAGLPPVRGGLDTPALGWTDEEVAALACPPLAQDIAAQRASWNAAFDAYAAAHPDSPLLHPASVPAWAGDGGGGGGGVAPRDRFLWALACVRSRAFSGPYAGPPLRARASLATALALAGAASVGIGHAPPDRVLTGAIAAVLFNILYDLGLAARVRWHAMAPLVDMANHAGAAASSMEYGYFDDAFQLAVQGRAHAPGDQVLISYGPQGNDGLVQYYGFAERCNPHDAARVDVRPGLRAVFGPAGPDPATVDAATAAGLGGGPPGVATPALHRALGAAAAAEAGRVRAWQGGGGGSLQPGRAALAAAFRAERVATLTSAAAACERAAKRLEAGGR